MRLLLILASVLVLSVIGMQESDASCVQNKDWSSAPCFDQGTPTQSEVVKAWDGYYDHKGIAFMEWKKIEMFHAAENEKFWEWITDKQENNNVYRYYLSINEIQNQFPVNISDGYMGGYMGQYHVKKQETSPLIPDISNNTKQSQEKIVITTTQDSRYRFGCDSRIPSFDNRPNCFSPPIAYVDIGQSVIFKNTGIGFAAIASGNAHDGPDGIFESGLMKSGSSYEISFDEKGIINYFDFISHYKAGTIIVGNSTINLPPVVIAGQSQIIEEGKLVKLSMVGDDPENGKLRYSWQQISGPSFKSSKTNFPKPPLVDYYPYFAETAKTIYFPAPNVYATTSFVFEATVIDNTLQRATETIQITIVDNFNSRTYHIVSMPEQGINSTKKSYTLEEALELARIRISMVNNTKQ